VDKVLVGALGLNEPSIILNSKCEALFCLVVSLLTRLASLWNVGTLALRRMSCSKGIGS
jgi:hypothetical protein